MIHIFNIPDKNLNSDIFFTETGWDLYIVDNKLHISGDCTFEEAENSLNSHNPVAPVEPTIQEKLASVGLNFEELKAAILGGN